MRGNNPGNLRRWGTYKVVQGFAVFPTVMIGLEAMRDQLWLYGKRNVNTIEKIVTTWAPASDNNPTSSYIANVSNRTGFSQHQVLDLLDPTTLGRLMYAMILQEQGSFSFDPNMIKQVANMSLGATFTGPIETAVEPAEALPATPTAGDPLPPPETKDNLEARVPANELPAAG